MKALKNAAALSGLCLVVALGLIICRGNTSPVAASEVSKTQTNLVITTLPLQSVVDIIKPAIWSAAENGYIRPEDLETLDFSTGDIEHGWNPKYYPKNRKPKFFYSIVGSSIDPAMKKEIEDISLNPETSQPFVTLRRYHYSKRGDMDILYLVIPNIDNKKCANKVATDLEIKITSSDIAVDSRILEGCIKIQETTSLFRPLISRQRISQNEKWHFEPRYKATPHLGFKIPD